MVNEHKYYHTASGESPGLGNVPPAYGSKDKIKQYKAKSLNSLQQASTSAPVNSGTSSKQYAVPQQYVSASSNVVEDTSGVETEPEDEEEPEPNESNTHSGYKSASSATTLPRTGTSTSQALPGRASLTRVKVTKQEAEELAASIFEKGKGKEPVRPPPPPHRGSTNIEQQALDFLEDMDQRLAFLGVGPPPLHRQHDVEGSSSSSNSRSHFSDAIYETDTPVCYSNKVGGSSSSSSLGGGSQFVGAMDANVTPVHYPGVTEDSMDMTEIDNGSAAAPAPTSSLSSAFGAYGGQSAFPSNGPQFINSFSTSSSFHTNPGAFAPSVEVEMDIEDSAPIPPQNSSSLLSRLSPLGDSIGASAFTSASSASTFGFANTAPISNSFDSNNVASNPLASFTSQTMNAPSLLSRLSDPVTDPFSSQSARGFGYPDPNTQQNAFNAFGSSRMPTNITSTNGFTMQPNSFIQTSSASVPFGGQDARIPNAHGQFVQSLGANAFGIEAGAGVFNPGPYMPTAYQSAPFIAPNSFDQANHAFVSASQPWMSNASFPTHSSEFNPGYGWTDLNANPLDPSQCNNINHGIPNVFQTTPTPDDDVEMELGDVSGAYCHAEGIPSWDISSPNYAYVPAMNTMDPWANMTPAAFSVDGAPALNPWANMTSAAFTAYGGAPNFATDAWSNMTSSAFSFGSHVFEPPSSLPQVQSEAPFHPKSATGGNKVVDLHDVMASFRADLRNFVPQFPTNPPSFHEDQLQDSYDSLDSRNANVDFGHPYLSAKRRRDPDEDDDSLQSARKRTREATTRPGPSSPPTLYPRRLKITAIPGRNGNRPYVPTAPARSKSGVGNPLKSLATLLKKAVHSFVGSCTQGTLNSMKTFSGWAHS